MLVRDAAALVRREDGVALGGVLDAALAAVDPAAGVERSVGLEGSVLRVGEHGLPLVAAARVWCIAVGKAAAAMAEALVRRIGPTRVAGGVVVVKHATERALAPLDGVMGAHPIPDARSVAAGRAVMDVLGRVRPDDVVIVLLSGGASSLMVVPVPGVSLEDLQALGGALLRSGASIEAINAVRKNLDVLKGGGLLRRAAPARVATLVLSDVVDAPLHVVGSGPTLPDPSGLAAARGVLSRHGVVAPPSVLRWLARAEPPSVAIEPGPIVVVGSNETAVEAALGAGRAEGWVVERLPSLHGEARERGRELAARLRAPPLERPRLLVAGGETTVTVRGSGRGGRNQELALAALLELEHAPGRPLLVTLATDGEDGPTDAAGAVVDRESAARARALGLAPAERLEHNDAHAVFAGLGDLLRIGPTGTNVCDLVVGLVRPRA